MTATAAAAAATQANNKRRKKMNDSFESQSQYCFYSTPRLKHLVCVAQIRLRCAFNVMYIKYGCLVCVQCRVLRTLYTFYMAKRNANISQSRERILKSNMTINRSSISCAACDTI